MSTIKKGDRVRSIKTNYQPFTGTVGEVFIGFVKVWFDKPQGPDNIHQFALINPLYLELIPEVEVMQGVASSGVIEGDGPELERQKLEKIDPPFEEE
jgi:hypothetical protein